MAFCINRVQLLGHVGKDPQVKTFANGGSLATFSLATSERWKDKASGDWKEKTEWHNIAVSAPALVTMCKNHVKKGTRLLLTGQIQTRKFTGNDGQERYITEIAVKMFGGELILLGELTRRAGSSNGSTRTAEREPADDGDPGNWGSGQDSFGGGGRVDDYSERPGLLPRMPP